MVYSEGAKILTSTELKEMIEEECNNPTIERLMFIETRAKGDQPGKIFPCYIFAWAMEPVEPGPAEALMFKADIVQMMGGDFGMLEVVLHEKEFGTKYRIWDKPPKKNVREETPFIEETVQ